MMIMMMMMTHPAAATKEVLGTPSLQVWVEALTGAGGGHRQVQHQPEPVLGLLGGGLEAAQPGVQARVEARVEAWVEAGVETGVEAGVEAIVPHHGVQRHQALGQGDQAAQQDNLGLHLKWRVVIGK